MFNTACTGPAWFVPINILFSHPRSYTCIRCVRRNGLRPGRYYVSRTERSDRLIFSSEVGVIDVPEDTIVYKGRLQPGAAEMVCGGSGVRRKWSAAEVV